MARDEVCKGAGMTGIIFSLLMAGQTEESHRGEPCIRENGADILGYFSLDVAGQADESHNSDFLLRAKYADIWGMCRSVRHKANSPSPSRSVARHLSALRSTWSQYSIRNFFLNKGGHYALEDLPSLPSYFDKINLEISLE